jgi:serine/threonine-protein kinase
MTDFPEQLSQALAERYRLERELGQGGMATVYLAEDLKHQRRVAIKVLKPELAAVIGAERFLREIQTVAALQHPHVLPLFDSGVAHVESREARVERSALDPRPSSLVYYVMPFVDGESLRDRLTRDKQLPIPDAVRIATEVASALDYAHRHGVIHRDIKPENILLHDGSALVADFGIALAVSRGEGAARMTETGMSLGTPTYMSPEQAMGEREIGPRSDIYSLGATTYEMLTGEPPFTGTTAQAIVARVMTEKPAPIRKVRDRVPEAVEDAVFTALEKLPADRFATAAEFIDALGTEGSGTRHARYAASATRSQRAVLAGVSALAVLGVTAAGWLAFSSPRAAPTVARYLVSTPGLKRTDQNFFGTPFALSPDGTRLAYVTNVGAEEPVLMLRDQADVAPHRIESTEGADAPFFSPDGQWIGYAAHRKLYKVSVSGGAPIALADAVPAFALGATWRADGTIIFNADPYHLLAVSADGGPTDTVVTMEPDRYAAFLTAVPGTDVMLVTECTNNCAQTELVAYDLRKHRRRVVLPDAVRAWALPKGLLIAVRVDGTVIGANFDPDALALAGSPVPLLSGVAIVSGIAPGMSVSANGTLVYRPAGGSGVSMMPVLVDRNGTVTALDPGWHDNMQYLALSPDGRMLAADVPAQGGRTDIWVKQLPAGPLSRLTFDGSLNYRAAWAPDGRSLSYSSDRDGLTHLYLQRADGSGKPERLMPYDSSQIDESEWSTDGQWLVYRSGVVGGKRDIYARATRGDTTRHTIAASSFDEYMPTLSPDGRWVAYVSVESGREEVWVRPFPDAGRARWQISTSGGSEPAWSHSGRELFFVAASDSMVAVQVSTGADADFRTGQRNTLFSRAALQIRHGAFHRSYAVAPDDHRFVMLQAVGTGDEAGDYLTIVLNWLAEARRQLQR